VSGVISYGELRIHPLPEGRFTVGADKRFVPHDPEHPLPTGTLFISVTPFLVETPAELLLLDTGLGEYASGRDISFLLDGIRRAGFEREDVTRVILSHLHLDHVGGAVFDAAGFDQPTFPNAVYVVQRGEAESADYTGSAAAVRDRAVHTLDAAGQLAYVEGDQVLTDEIELRLTGGHTAHHQVVRIHTGGRVAVFGGDVLPAPGQITRTFRAKYDVDPARSQAERARLAAEAAEHGHLLLLYHSPERPAAHVAETRHGLAIEPVGAPVSG
jgi:glyoxylase-like metal-dependent hydrolase (beta-lactamase superfamily II)